MKTQKNTLTPSTQMLEKKSLFNSIVDNDNLQMAEFENQCLANRVGLIRKILVNRSLDALRWDFENKINDIVKDFANRIDNELHSTKKD